MRAHWFRTPSSVMVATLLGVAGANAQDATGAQQVTFNANGSPSAAEIAVEGVQADAATTPSEQVAQANEIVRRSGQLAERLSKMLDEARREKDILRANCVNRKLTEVNANSRNVEQRAQALRSAVSTNDESRRAHEYTVLTVLSQKLTSLDQEATQCLGQAVYEPGASQVITTIAASSVSSVNPIQTGGAPQSPPTVFTPPPATSPAVSMNN